MHRQVYLRTDASRKIGTGHIVRCLALAKALRNQGMNPVFICREHPGHMGDALANESFKVRWLSRPRGQVVEKGNAYASWLGVSMEHDAQETVAVLEQKKAEWIIVDHYGLDARWEKTLRRYTARLMCIDDLADRKHDCDLLLDQNRLGTEDPYHRLTPATCEHLLGPRFALLRPEFGRLPASRKTRSGPVRRILVYFGSVDPTHETRKVLAVVKQMPHKHFGVDVVLSSLNQGAGALRSRYAKIPWIQFHANVQRMDLLMQKADLAIGAAGTTTWERCCLGLPSLVICVAENQRVVAESLQRAGAGWFLGTPKQVTLGRLLKALNRVMRNPDQIQIASQRGLALVDGRGVTRVVDRMLARENC